MNKKQIEFKLGRLEFAVMGLQKDCIDMTKYLTVDQAKKRDYIVRTNNIGKLVHKQLIEDFKNEVEVNIHDTFNSICTKILNYEFYDKDFKINRLDEFSKILKEYELKQIVIDTYKEKKNAN